MKAKLILFLSILLLAAATQGSPLLIAEFSETIIARDTIQDSVRVDTVYSDETDITGAKTLAAYFQLDGLSGTTDTNWADDSFFVFIQISWAKDEDRHWYTIGPLDTFETTDSANYPALISVQDSCKGADRLRGMMIHWDSTDVDMPTPFGNTYGKEFKLWIRTWE